MCLNPLTGLIMERAIENLTVTGLIPPKEQSPLPLLLRQVVRDNTYLSCNSLMFTALDQERGSLPSGLSTVLGRLELCFSRKHPKPKLDLKKMLRGFHNASFIKSGVHPGKLATLGWGENIKPPVKRVPGWHTRGCWLGVWVY